MNPNRFPNDESYVKRMADEQIHRNGRYNDFSQNPERALLNKERLATRLRNERYEQAEKRVEAEAHLSGEHKGKHSNGGDKKVQQRIEGDRLEHRGARFFCGGAQKEKQHQLYGGGPCKRQQIGHRIPDGGRVHEAFD